MLKHDRKFVEEKHAFVSTGVPRRLSNSFQMNDAGVVRAVSKGPSSLKEDSTFRVTDIFLGPYVVMSASDAETAKDIILAMPLSGGSIHLVADKNGNAYIIETTATLKAVRVPGEITEMSINRLLSDGAIFESKVALPGQGILYICPGNPDYPEWGRFVPDDTGTFSRFDLKDSPKSSTLSLLQNADIEILKTAKSLMRIKYQDTHNYLDLLERFQKVKERYWKANQELSRAVISNDREQSLFLYGRASTYYLAVQSESAFLKDLADRTYPVSKFIL